jgi:two-component system OmpR family response regulator
LPERSGKLFKLKFAPAQNALALFGAEMRVLIIEDDLHTSAFIAKGLGEDGHVADQVNDGKRGLFLATTEKYDVIILDRMLPIVDGLTILRTLRASEIQTPVLILSAIAEVEHRVEGLKAGADDYLVKPFSYSELSARIDCLFRRRHSVDAEVTELNVANLKMDLLTREVTRAGHPIDLQPREFRLLEYLMRNAGRVVTRTMLLESVWDYHFDPQTNVIDVHISRLRQKLAHDHEPPIIHTVRGAGYQLGGPG